MKNSKKVKFMGLALATGLITLGAGYAANWNDSVEANGTINTGTLKVAFESAGVNTSVPGSESVIVGPQALSTDCKTFTFEMNNLSPNKSAILSAKVKNNGTIPAKLDRVDVSFGKVNGTNTTDEDANYLAERITVKGNMLVDKNGNGSTTDSGDASIPVDTTLNALNTHIANLLTNSTYVNNLIINPIAVSGSTTSVGAIDFNELKFKLVTSDSDNANDFNTKTQGKDITLKITPKFIQGN